MRIIVGALILLLVAAACPAQELLPIETGPQDPLIHAIAPADGAVAVTDPPPMVFWYADAASWTVQFARDQDFADPVTVEGIELPMYNHSAALGEGVWHWRYRYANEAGQPSDWSATRSFTVTTDSIPFPVPTMDEILADMPGHPRIYTTDEGLAEFQARADGPAKTSAESLIRIATSLLEIEPPLPELGGTATDNPERRGVLFRMDDGVPRQCLDMRPGTVENLSLRARDLSLAWLISGDRRFADAAAKWLVWQAAFRIDAHQENRAHHDTVHCYEYGLQRIASAYDSVYDVLTSEQRQAVLSHIQYHGDACYRKLRYKIRIHRKHQTSHAQQDMHELLTTALAVANDLPDAHEWLSYLIPQYVNRLAFGANDGGYSEGHYYNYKWHGMLRCALAMKTATGIDLFRKPRFSNAGRFWLYCMSLNYWWPHFGDNFGLITPMSGSSNDRDGVNFLASVYGDRYVKWWANQIDGDLQRPLVYFSDETLREKPPVDIPQAAIFPDVGWAALYDRFWDHSSARLFFKSSPWGSHSHSHQDQNSFVIHAFGQPLAIDKGYYGYYGDEYHKKICQASRSHNTILVDGEGQGHGIQFNGQIADFFDARDFSFVMGDATAAYGDRLSSFLRAVVFIRPDCFVIYDQIEAEQPHRYSWQLNTLNEMALDQQSQIITVQEPGAKLEVSHLLPGDLTYRQSNERPYELKARYIESFPEQWTAWCETPEPATSARFLTVLTPYRDQDGVALVEARSIETEGLVGCELQLRDGNYTVLFQRDMNAPARHAAGDITTDAVCTVIRDATSPDFMHVSGTTLTVDGRDLVRADALTSTQSATEVAINAEDAPPIALELHDSHGTFEVPLEATADRWGTRYYFARFDPREEGRYRLDLDPEQVAALASDRFDPAHNSAGPDVELRRDCEVILRCDEWLTENVVAALTESYSGRIINLVRNGNFEAGSPGYPPIGWWVRHFSTGDPSYLYWSDEDPAEGERCMKVYRDTNRIRSYSQTIPVTRPGRYVLSFKAKATCAGASVNTSWSANSMSVAVEPSDKWREYRVERDDVQPHRACIHVLFENAEGPDQTLWVDDLRFGPMAE